MEILQSFFIKIVGRNLSELRSYSKDYKNYVLCWFKRIKKSTFVISKYSTQLNTYFLSNDPYHENQPCKSSKQNTELTTIVLNLNVNTFF